MPTYEYRCKACGEHLEVVQSFKDSPLTECAACGGPLRKVFGNIGITFKGSGFYKTDSRSDGHRGSSKTAEPKSGEASASGTSTSASKGSEGTTGSSSSSGSSGSSTKPEGASKASSEPRGKSGSKSVAAAAS